MFSKSDRGGTGTAIPSIVGTSMKVSGDLDSEGAVQIEGTVEGDVRCADVTVGRDAHVRGQIEADSAKIHGTVNGEMRARSVVLSATARVIGDIVHEEIAISAGAYVEGQMLRRDADQSRLNLVVTDKA